MALARPEVPNTEVRSEDALVALSGLLCSESQERTKRSLPYPSQALVGKTQLYKDGETGRLLKDFILFSIL